MTEPRTGTTTVRSILDAFDEPLVLRADDGRWIDVNAAFLEAFAAEGSSREDLLDPARAGDALDESVRGLVDDVRGGVAVTLRDVAVWRAGTPEHRRVDLVSTPLRPDGGLLLRFVRRGAAAARRSAGERDSRRAIVGALAAGIAHDINNQLAASMNIAILLSEDLAHDPTHEDALHILVSASREAASLSRRLLRLVGRGEPCLEELALGPVVEAIVMLLRHELPASDRLSTTWEEETPAVHVDAARLEHLVALLLLTAADAAGEEGRVDVHVRPEGPFALLEVTVHTATPLRAEDAASALARTMATELGGTFEVSSADGATRFGARFPGDARPSDGAG